VKPEICTSDGCGQEVRHGWRDGKKGWWHREAVDHQPIFGRRFTDADKAKVELELDVVRTRQRTTKDGEVVTEEYTARGERLRAMNKAKREKLLEEGLDEEEIAALHQICIPEPEVRKTTIERSDERCPQGARNLMNAAAKAGWEVRRLTYSRGPWLGAKGNVLSISDLVACGVVDSDKRYGVACWRDGKVVSAWYGEREADRVPMALTTITVLKNKMKEAPRG
jgi:hypothetical protein